MSATPRQSFHFQPLDGKGYTDTDNAPLLFSSQPAHRVGKVTVFYRTRRTLRKRLGVYDPGEVEGVLSIASSGSGEEQMIRALNRASNYRYLFPDGFSDEDCRTCFSDVLAQTLVS